MCGETQLMNKLQNPPKLWIAIGAGVSALATVFSLIAAVTTEQHALYISLAGASLLITVLALRAVYAAFGQQRPTDTIPRQPGSDDDDN